MAICMDSPC